ncbi:Dipeptidyl-peptidase 6 [Shimia sp. SK013]|nr:Dipeptidyl-peptidase 6 [Shimia sp. SK013]
MDRRLTLANTRVAHSSLKAEFVSDKFVDGEPKQVAGYPFLLNAPQGDRDRQLLSGDMFLVIEEVNGCAFGQSMKDGYVGYVHGGLMPPREPTHRIVARSTWAYRTPDFKSQAAIKLHHGSQVAAVSQNGRWTEIDLTSPSEKNGATCFLPTAHLAPANSSESDPASVAERFLGTPYVWAGNTGDGIDCSGLVQAALLACGTPCPGDSDLQEAAFPDATGPYRRGDLMFWKGHVAMVTDPDTLIHANAHHMAVAYEPIANAIARIKAQGDGPVTSHKRPAYGAST